MKLFSKSSVRLSISLLCLLAAGCVGGRKTSYTKVEVGPHGQVTRMTPVKYTPEQQAARDAAVGYVPRTPLDADLADVEQRWPKLTAEQRASVVQTVKQMAGE